MDIVTSVLFILLGALIPLVTALIWTRRMQQFYAHKAKIDLDAIPGELSDELAYWNECFEAIADITSSTHSDPEKALDRINDIAFGARFPYHRHVSKDAFPIYLNNKSG